MTHPINIPYTLTTQSMGRGPSALASARSLLQTQNLGDPSRPTQSDCVVSQDHQAICMNIKFWDLLPYGLTNFIPILSEVLSFPGILKEMVGLRHAEKQTRSLDGWWKNQFYSWLLSFTSPGSSLQDRLSWKVKKEALWSPQGHGNAHLGLPKGIVVQIFSERQLTLKKCRV